MTPTRSQPWKWGELSIETLRYLEEHGPTATPQIEHDFGVKVHSEGRGIRKALCMHERSGRVKRTPRGGYLTMERKREKQMSYDIWEITEDGKQWWAWRDWQSESAMLLRERSLAFGVPIFVGDVPDDYFGPKWDKP